MKKMKRFLALFGAVLLFALYGSTLFFAFTDRSAAMGMLKASIACTIIIPVLLYAYTLVYKNIRGDHQKPEELSYKDDTEQDNQT